MFLMPVNRPYPGGNNENCLFLRRFKPSDANWEPETSHTSQYYSIEGLMGPTNWACIMPRDAMDLSHDRKTQQRRSMATFAVRFAVRWQHPWWRMWLLSVCVRLCCKYGDQWHLLLLCRGVCLRFFCIYQMHGLRSWAKPLIILFEIYAVKKRHDRAGLTLELDSGHKNKKIGFIQSLCDQF